MSILSDIENTEKMGLFIGLVRQAYFSVNKSAQTRFFAKLDQEEADRDALIKKRAHEEYLQCLDRANEESKGRLDKSYNHSIDHMNGGHIPTKVEWKRDKGGRSEKDKLVCAFSIPYELPNGDKHIYSIEIENSRGLADTSDDDYIRRMTVDACQHFLHEKDDLYRSLSEGNLPKQTLGVNAIIASARKIGVSGEIMTSEKVRRHMKGIDL